MFSAFNPSKCTHTWSSGKLTLRRPGSSWGFGALLKGLTSVVDNSCRSRDSNPQPRVTSPTLYTLGHNCPLKVYIVHKENESLHFFSPKVMGDTNVFYSFELELSLLNFLLLFFLSTQGWASFATLWTQ